MQNIPSKAFGGAVRCGAGSMSLECWEYRSARIGADATSELNALGQQGWQMCGIINDTFWFCRSRIQRELAEQGDAIAAQRSSMPTATHRGGGAG